MRAAVPGAVVGDHVGLGDHLDGPDRHQRRVAGAEADAVAAGAVSRRRTCAARSRSLFLARHRVDRGRGHGAAAAAAAHHQVVQPRRVRGQRLLGLGGADEADRDADARRPGAARPPRSSPAAGTARWARCRPRPRRRPAGPATAPARRRCGWCPARRPAPGTAGSASVHTTSLSAGSRLRVTPLATICASQRIGAPARSASRARGDHAGGEGEVAYQVDHAAGVDHPDRDLADVGGQPGEVRLGADGGEGLAVDRRAVLLVVEHGVLDHVVDHAVPRAVATASANCSAATSVAPAS